MSNTINKTKGLAMVSGGSFGLGKALIKRFSEDGWQTVNADVREPEYYHEFADFYKGDLCNGEHMQELYDYTLKNHGVPQVLILNAGVGVHEKLTEGDPEKWQRAIDTNIMAPLRLIRAFAPAMCDSGNGHIIFISSVSASHPYSYGGVYSASKAALEAIAESLRLETSGKLKVSVVAAGLTSTSFFDHELSGNRSLSHFEDEALDPAEIADIIIEIVQEARPTEINKIIVRPRGQQF